MSKITKVKFKDSKRIIKLFNKNLITKIWKEIKNDFKEYKWEDAELHIKNNEIYILFKNLDKIDS